MPSTKSTIKIPSLTPGWNLDSWCYVPDESSLGPLPVIVMAHGFGSNKLMGLAEYAEAFSALGYAVLVFDYRRWGASDGTPRHVLSVREQLDDYRTVIKYARQQPEFDAQRAILWGSSFSGGHSITLASEPELNVFAAITQCPFTGLAGPPPLTHPSFFGTLFYALLDSVKQAVGLAPVYVPTGAEPRSVGILTTPGSKTGLLAICKNESDCPNEISASALLSVASYNPSAKVANISRPVLIVVPAEDNLCLPAGMRRVAKRATKGTVELAEVPGGHFEVYPGCAHHDPSLKAQISFLQKHVPQ